MGGGWKLNLRGSLCGDGHSDGVWETGAYNNGRLVRSCSKHLRVVMDFLNGYEDSFV